MENQPKDLLAQPYSRYGKIAVLLLVVAFVFFVGLRWHVATELTAVVTAVYAILVFYQLKEMEKQREQQRVENEEERRREFDRRPILRLGPFEAKAPFLRLASEHARDTNRLLGTGLYVNIPLTNNGQTLARKCQPVLTAWGECTSEGKWRREANWLPIGLTWVLDEPNLYAAGKPTEERDLVPNRPYLFNLGCTSTRHPDEFVLLLVVRPSAQDSSFAPGDYCFEVTAFSENAEPAVRWYQAKWRGGFLGTIAKDDASQFLFVGELPQAPWSA